MSIRSKICDWIDGGQRGDNKTIFALTDTGKQWVEDDPSSSQGSRALMGLHELNSGTCSQIAQESHIPYPTVITIMKLACQRGLARTVATPDLF